MDYILTAENITKDFASHRALDNVSIAVPRGKIYGLLGPNGAGKTTLIRIINHITAPDSGIVTFDGHTLCEKDIYNIGYLPEERGLYKKMKVGDQALFFSRLKGLPAKTAEQELKRWFEHLEISDWWNRKVEELSKGMAQKVQFIVTVLHRPKLLIFDEPFSGFDPINAGILKREILRLRDEGATVIFSTHNMGSVEELCDEITLINKSRNILSGNVSEIRERFSTNEYSLSFIGDPERLRDAAAAMCSSFELGGINNQGHATVRVKLLDADALRPFVAAANDSVLIHSFNRLLPSMDDIFVAAVNASDVKTI